MVVVDESSRFIAALPNGIMAYSVNNEIAVSVQHDPYRWPVKRKIRAKKRLRNDIRRRKRKGIIPQNYQLCVWSPG
jgi:hypothetical protein